MRGQIETQNFTQVSDVVAGEGGCRVVGGDRTELLCDFWLVAIAFGRYTTKRFDLMV